MLVAMVMLGHVRRARPRVGWSAPERLDQGTDVRGLINKGLSSLNPNYVLICKRRERNDRSTLGLAYPRFLRAGRTPVD